MSITDILAQMGFKDAVVRDVPQLGAKDFATNLWQGPAIGAVRMLQLPSQLRQATYGLVGAQVSPREQRQYQSLDTITEAPEYLGDPVTANDPHWYTNPSWYARTLGEQVPRTVAAIGAGLLTGGASSGVAAFAAFGGVEVAGSTYIDARDRRMERGESFQDASHGALGEAVVVGAVTAALERVGGEYLFNTFGPKFQGALTTYLGKRASQYLGRASTRTGRIAQETLAEGLTEFLQEGSEAFITSYMEQDPSLREDWLDRSLKGLAGGLLMGGAMATVGEYAASRDDDPLGIQNDVARLIESGGIDQNAIAELRRRASEGYQLDSRNNFNKLLRDPLIATLQQGDPAREQLAEKYKGGENRSAFVEFLLNTEGQPELGEYTPLVAAAEGALGEQGNPDVLYDSIDSILTTMEIKLRDGELDDLARSQVAPRTGEVRPENIVLGDLLSDSETSLLGRAEVAGLDTGFFRRRLDNLYSRLGMEPLRGLPGPSPQSGMNRLFGESPSVAARNYASVASRLDSGNAVSPDEQQFVEFVRAGMDQGLEIGAIYNEFMQGMRGTDRGARVAPTQASQVTQLREGLQELPANAFVDSVVDWSTGMAMDQNGNVTEGRSDPHRLVGFGRIKRARGETEVTTGPAELGGYVTLAFSGVMDPYYTSEIAEGRGKRKKQRNPQVDEYFTVEPSDTAEFAVVEKMEPDPETGGLRATGKFKQVRVADLNILQRGRPETQTGPGGLGRQFPTGYVPYNRGRDVLPSRPNLNDMPISEVRKIAQNLGVQHTGKVDQVKKRIREAWTKQDMQRRPPVRPQQQPQPDRRVLELPEDPNAPKLQLPPVKPGHTRLTRMAGDIRAVRDIANKGIRADEQAIDNLTDTHGSSNSTIQDIVTTGNYAGVFNRSLFGNLLVVIDIPTASYATQRREMRTNIAPSNVTGYITVDDSTYHDISELRQPKAAVPQESGTQTKIGQAYGRAQQASRTRQAERNLEDITADYFGDVRNHAAFAIQFPEDAQRLVSGASLESVGLPQVAPDLEQQFRDNVAAVLNAPQEITDAFVEFAQNPQTELRLKPNQWVQVPPGVEIPAGANIDFYQDNVLGSFVKYDQRARRAGQGRGQQRRMGEAYGRAQQEARAKKEARKGAAWSIPNLAKTFKISNAAASAVDAIARAMNVNVSKIFLRRGGEPDSKSLNQMIDAAYEMQRENIRYTDQDEFFGEFNRRLNSHITKLRAFTRTGNISPVAVDRAVESAAVELLGFLENNPQFQEYYRKDNARERAIVSKAFPELGTNDAAWAFYKLTGAVGSSNTALWENVTEQIAAWEQFRQSGKFDVTVNRKAQSGTISGRGITLTKAKGYSLLNQMLEKHGSMEAVIEYLLEPVTIADVQHNMGKEYGWGSQNGTQALGIKDTVSWATGHEFAERNDRTRIVPRVFIFGPKVGAYAMNHWGFHEYTTIDVWESRFWRSFFKDLPDESGLVQDSNARGLFAQLSKRFSDRLGVETSSGQAVRWYYVKMMAAQAGYDYAKLSKERKHEALQTISELAETRISKVIAETRPGRQATLPGGNQKRGGSSRIRDILPPEVFGEQDVDTLRQDKSQRVGRRTKAYVNLRRDGTALITALQYADVSSAIHELAHVARRQLLSADSMSKRITAEDRVTVENWAGAKDGIWTIEAEEKFARAFERYIREGKAPMESLRSVFEKLKRWMREVYQRIAGTPIDVRITPEVKAVLDKLFIDPTNRMGEAYGRAQVESRRARDRFRDSGPFFPVPAAPVQVAAEQQATISEYEVEVGGTKLKNGDWLQYKDGTPFQVANAFYDHRQDTSYINPSYGTFSEHGRVPNEIPVGAVKRIEAPMPSPEPETTVRLSMFDQQLVYAMSNQAAINELADEFFPPQKKRRFTPYEQSDIAHIIAAFGEETGTRKKKVLGDKAREWLIKIRQMDKTGAEAPLNPSVKFSGNKFEIADIDEDLAKDLLDTYQRATPYSPIRDAEAELFEQIEKLAGRKAAVFAPEVDTPAVNAARDEWHEARRELDIAQAEEEAALAAPNAYIQEKLLEYGKQAGIPVVRGGGLSKAKKYDAQKKQITQQIVKHAEYNSLLAKLNETGPALQEKQEAYNKANRKLNIEQDKYYGNIAPGTMLISKREGPRITFKIESFDVETGQYNFTPGSLTIEGDQQTFYPTSRATNQLSPAAANQNFYKSPEQFQQINDLRMQIEDAVRTASQERQAMQRVERANGKPSSESPAEADVTLAMRREQNKSRSMTDKVRAALNSRSGSLKDGKIKKTLNTDAEVTAESQSVSGLPLRLARKVPTQDEKKAASAKRRKLPKDRKHEADIDDQWYLYHVDYEANFPGVAFANATEGLDFIQAGNEIGVEWEMTDPADWAASENGKRHRQLARAWDGEDFGLLDAEYRDKLLGSVAAPAALDATMVVGYPELWPKNDGGISDSVFSFLKKLAADIPEFAFNPVFTVEQGAKGIVLAYSNGQRIRIAPEVLLIDPAELALGQTVGVDLASLGIQRVETADDVIKRSLSNAGIKIKDGKARLGNSPAVMFWLEGDRLQYQIPKGTENNSQVQQIVDVLSKIRVRQPGQLLSHEGGTDQKGGGSQEVEQLIDQSRKMLERMRRRAKVDWIEKRMDSLASDARKGNSGAQEILKNWLAANEAKMIVPPPKPYSEMTVKELRQYAKEAGIKGYAGLKRDQLVGLLSIRTGPDMYASYIGVPIDVLLNSKPVQWLKEQGAKVILRRYYPLLPIDGTAVNTLRNYRSKQQQEVIKMYEAAEGAMQHHGALMEMNLRNLEKAVIDPKWNRRRRQLSKQDMAELQLALESSAYIPQAAQKLGNNPDQVKAISDAMFEIRNHIDSLTNELIQKGVLEGQALGTAQKNLNLGAYFHVSYQAFDDARWPQKVPNHVIQNARVAVANEYSLLNHMAPQEVRALASQFDIKRTIMSKREMLDILDQQIQGGLPSNINKMGFKQLKKLADQYNVPFFLKDRTAYFREIRDAMANAGRSSEVELSQDSINNIVDEILHAGTAADPLMGPLGMSIRNAPFAKKELSVLMRRGNVPQWLSDLWGKYDSVRANYVKTVFKQARLAAMHDTLTQFAKLEGTLWTRRINHAKGFSLRLTGNNHPNWLPLSKLAEHIDPQTGKNLAKAKARAVDPPDDIYIHPELGRYLSELAKPGSDDRIMKTLLQMQAWSKQSMTAWSVRTGLRNFVGNFGFSLMMGHAFTTHGGTFNALRQIPGLYTGGGAVGAATRKFNPTTAKQRQQILERYRRLGLIESAQMSEIQALLRDIDGKTDAQAEAWLKLTSDELADTGVSGVAKKVPGAQGAYRAIKSAGRKLSKFYTAMDAAWKIAAFEQELKWAKEKYGLDGVEAEQHAAEIVKNLMPTYSRIPKPLQSLRKFPLLGTFVSFNAEVVRTYANTMKLIHSELNSDNPAVQGLAHRRIAGMMAAFFWQHALKLGLATIGLAAVGMSADEDRRARAFLPWWEQFDTIIWLRRPTQGQTGRFLNLSYMDPYNMFWNAFRAGATLFNKEDERLFQDKLTLAAGTVLSPWVGQDILVQTLFEVLSNRTETNAPIRKESDTLGMGAIRSLMHMSPAIVPGTARSIGSLLQASGVPGFIDRNVLPSGLPFRMEAAFPKERDYGEEYTFSTELLRFLGTAPRELNLDRALRWNAGNYRRVQSGSQRDFTSLLFRERTPAAIEIASQYRRTERRRLNNFVLFRDQLKLAAEWGMSNQELLGLLKSDAGITNTQIEQLYTGLYQPYVPGVQTWRGVQRVQDRVNSNRNDPENPDRRIQDLWEMLNQYFRDAAENGLPE